MNPYLDIRNKVLCENYEFLNIMYLLYRDKKTKESYGSSVTVKQAILRSRQPSTVEVV